MQSTFRALLALNFAALAFLTLFHAFVLSQVHPGYVSEYPFLAPLLAGLWAIGIVEVCNCVHRSAPLLALGFFAAFGYGFFLRQEGSAIVGWLFVAFSLAGELTLGKTCFQYLSRFPAPKPNKIGEARPSLLNHAGGESSAYLQNLR